MLQMHCTTPDLRGDWGITVDLPLADIRHLYHTCTILSPVPIQIWKSFETKSTRCSVDHPSIELPITKTSSMPMLHVAGNHRLAASAHYLRKQG